MRMKKIDAHISDCIPDDTNVIIDDYLNKDGNGELTVNLDIGDRLLIYFRETKKDGSFEYVVVDIDKNSKELTRYVAQKVDQTIVSDGLLTDLCKTFELAQASN